ncbi:MAG: glucokinase [Candidatus Rokuibacteriota bacterium]
MILAGDIGGTNARLALFERAGARLRTIVSRKYPSRRHSSLEEIVERFLGEVEAPIERACFAVAGPASDGRVVATNLAWIVDAGRLARAMRLDSVDLINDLEAIAHGLGDLEDSDLAVLHPGRPGSEGNRAIIAAGTGLGQAGAYWDGNRHHPFACEGGHGDFGPRTAAEGELLAYLLAKYDRVSYERVVSGSGLHEIYRFLRDSGGGPEPPWLTRELAEEPPPAVISRAALEGRSDLCRDALNRFVSIYGAEAGNLALKMMARGGIWIGGGIAPKILPRLGGSTFVEAFLAKGRMQPLLETIPVRLILNEGVGLLGAARYAAT